MNVAAVLKKPEANFFFSFVVGLGLAVLMFHRPQTEVEVSAIPPAKLKEMVSRVDGKCYRFRVEDASCPAARVSL
jgi:hypothetical protein